MHLFSSERLFKLERSGVGTGFLFSSFSGDNTMVFLFLFLLLLLFFRFFGNIPKVDFLEAHLVGFPYAGGDSVALRDRKHRHKCRLRDARPVIFESVQHVVLDFVN